jgi:hypothetical protein
VFSGGTWSHGPHQRARKEPATEIKARVAQMTSGWWGRLRACGAPVRSARRRGGVIIRAQGHPHAGDVAAPGHVQPPPRAAPPSRRELRGAARRSPARSLQVPPRAWRLRQATQPARQGVRDPRAALETRRSRRTRQQLCRADPQHGGQVGHPRGRGAVHAAAALRRRGARRGRGAAPQGRCAAAWARQLPGCCSACLNTGAWRHGLRPRPAPAARRSRTRSAVASR